MGSREDDWERRQAKAREQHEERMKALQDRIDRSLQKSHDRAMEAIKRAGR